MNEFEDKVRLYVSRRGDNGNLYHKEGNELEYKENFGHKSWSSYLKCMASFANNRGGTIVFGVKDKPNTPIGIERSEFENIDPASFTKHLQEYFDPEIHYEISVIESDNKWFGFFMLKKLKISPLFAKKILEKNYLKVIFIIAIADVQKK